MNWLDEIQRLIAIARREERLRAAAEKIMMSKCGRHLFGCAAYYESRINKKCDCGLDALREALKETS